MDFDRQNNCPYTEALRLHARVISCRTHAKIGWHIYFDIWHIIIICIIEIKLNSVCQNKIGIQEFLRLILCAILNTIMFLCTRAPMYVCVCVCTVYREMNMYVYERFGTNENALDFTLYSNKCRRRQYVGFDDEHPIIIFLNSFSLILIGGSALYICTCI